MTIKLDQRKLETENIEELVAYLKDFYLLLFKESFVKIKSRQFYLFPKRTKYTDSSYILANLQTCILELTETIKRKIDSTSDENKKMRLRGILAGFARLSDIKSDILCYEANPLSVDLHCFCFADSIDLNTVDPSYIHEEFIPRLPDHLKRMFPFILNEAFLRSLSTDSNAKMFFKEFLHRLSIDLNAMMLFIVNQNLIQHLSIDKMIKYLDATYENEFDALMHHRSKKLLYAEIMRRIKKDEIEDTDQLKVMPLLSKIPKEFRDPEIVEEIAIKRGEHKRRVKNRLLSVHQNHEIQRNKIAAARERVDRIEDEAAMFNIIYDAIYDGQTKYRKTRRFTDEKVEDATIWRNTILQHVENSLDSRTAVAWSLTQDFLDKKITEQQLFAKIYIESFKRSSWFAMSKMTGSTFFRAKSLTEEKVIAGLATHADLQNVTRSKKIGDQLSRISKRNSIA